MIGNFFFVFSNDWKTGALFSHHWKNPRREKKEDPL
jgi:hypothetical protein